MSLKLGNLVLDGRCHVMGILNVTPDSFYDGGKHFDLVDTKKRVDSMIKEGAKIIDIGGESTRPGSKPVIVKEEMERDCLNPYSVTKVAAEDLCKMYTDLYDLKTVIFRYFNVYGDRQPTRGQYAPVIGLFQRQKMNDEPMTIVGDGEQTRDYTNVLDVVNANIMAAESDNVGNAEVFNVGYGESHSILDLVDMIGGDYIHIPARKGEARHTQAATTNIKNKIGWKAQIMLKDYIYNWRKNGSN